ncbi:MAG TPA: SRPBCC family protein [Streptosporangiaceae bacterium]|jgi:Polyketide cyclase / dehydrase and lipid transport|nr:SRPBCC family protein [Streptosporangiaceae bacterium]
MTSSRHRLAGRIQVDLPPSETFRLFTPRGEEDWAHGWHPRFPVSAADDSEPGTVFETRAHGQHATWLVTSRDPDSRISYARVIPGEQAGTVTITIRACRGGTEVEVVYDLTALTNAANLKLGEFAASYPAYLQSWHDAIFAWLTGLRGRNSDPVS